MGIKQVLYGWAALFTALAMAAIVVAASCLWVAPAHGMTVEQVILSPTMGLRFVMALITLSFGLGLLIRVVAPLLAKSID